MATMTSVHSVRLGLLAQAVFLIALITGSVIIAQDKPKELTEVTRLKAENFRLKAQLVNCSEAISKAQLQKEQNDVTELVKKELGSDCKFNWNTLTCE